MEIWVNPACSKCRAATTALDEAGIAYTVRRYLDEPPTADELRAVVERLGVEPWHVARPKETAEAGIDLPKDAAHRDDWFAAMAANPRVIQRPIITADDGTTVVGRDPESLGRVLSAESPQDARDS
jgi:arsenate reductase